MEAELKLIFPFKIEDKQHKSKVKSRILQKENIVSISLPFKINIEVEYAQFRLRKKYETTYIYVFVFSCLKKAKAFIDGPAAKVCYDAENNVNEIENEMNEFIEKYDNGCKKNKNKVLAVDEEGFSYYI